MKVTFWFPVLLMCSVVVAHGYGYFNRRGPPAKSRCDKVRVSNVPFRKLILEDDKKYDAFIDTEPSRSCVQVQYVLDPENDRKGALRTFQRGNYLITYNLTEPRPGIWNLVSQINPADKQTRYVTFIKEINDLIYICGISCDNQGINATNIHCVAERGANPRILQNEAARIASIVNLPQYYLVWDDACGNPP